MLSGLADIFADHAPFQGLAQALQAGGQRRASILQAAKPLFIGALWRALNVPVLVVCPKPEDARRLYDRVLAYWGEDAPIHHFVELEALPFERLAQDLASVHQRLKALAALAADAGHGPPPLVVTSALGVAVKTLPPAKFLPDASPYSMVRRGDRISLEGLLAHWASLGYRMEPHTEMPGTMSRRGGIVDVFPPTAALPIRLELWGDVVEGLRAFDPGTQRSLGPVELVSLVPAQEVLPAVADRRSVEDVIRSLDYSRCRATVRQGMEEELSLLLSGQAVEETTFYTGLFNGSSLLDFLPSQGLLVLDEPAEVEEASRDLDRRSWELRTLKVERGEVPGGFPSPYWGWDDVAGRLARAQKRLHLSRWAEDGSSDLVFVQAPSFWGRLDAFLQEALGRMQRGERVLAVTNHAQRLQEVMAERDLASLVVERLEALPPPGSVTLVRGSLGEGWVSSSATGAVALFTDGELFGTVKVSRPRRTRGAAREVALEELVTGSYVVHIDHGVARFAGTTTLEHDEEAREYLVLEYAEDDKLYVPTDHLDRVARYVASGDEPPSLTRLGTQEWLRIKERVRRSTQEMAQELLALYAAREVAQGIPLAADSPWQRELEDSFPYVETPDQVKAIGEVKREMELPRPMDRLVCGDVGYGKTEVALRAAFKAVMSGYQVALLVPTTVLAQQHYATFSQRLSPYPLIVEVLSRFRTDEEQRQVVEGLGQGKVDICIGTHRLLQRDVRFKNLGLAIVDEEHRFGVAHKERLKRLRHEVDVLTLSATPIPRTLHMALSGLRDMSTMETPPEERLPIKTYVSERSEQLIREAILRELDRGGQVYFLHNRVHSLASAADSLRKLVPEATFAVAHGRMREEGLEQVMAKFVRGEGDVLVCTTIIESGLDLPNVNTLIVDRADTLGLASLYQLRGRIGRGGHRAYAYLLVPRGRRITEAAQRRLETILAATELGAGFRIAMKDLEIRGAGNLLGAEQSGHIHAVGFDLYSQLLAQAVEEVRTGKAPPLPGVEEQRQDIALNLQLPARIPSEYVEDLPTRLGLYQRLSRADSPEQVAQVQGELRDRFGPLPQEVHNLLYLVRVRVLARKAGVEAVHREPRAVAIRLIEEVGGARLALEKALGPGVRVGNRLIHLAVTAGRHLEKPWGQRLLEVLEGLAAFRDNVSALAPRHG